MSSGVGGLLLLDTCGSRGSVALFQEARLTAVAVLPDRLASVALVGAIQNVLGESGMTLADVEAIGVVNGPGSFTGLRVGLAVAKGLCEAAGLHLVAVSRLEVLQRLAPTAAVAVLGAGRDQVYVRDDDGREFLADLHTAQKAAGSRPMVFAEPQTAALFPGHTSGVHEVKAADAVVLVRERLLGGGEDPALVNPNYVRDEAAIYRRDSAPVQSAR